MSQTDKSHSDNAGGILSGTMSICYFPVDLFNPLPETGVRNIMKETFKKGGWQIPVKSGRVAGTAPPFFSFLIPQKTSTAEAMPKMNLLVQKPQPRQITAG